MTLTPFLMFAGEAEEAIRFYAVFPDAEIVSLEHYGPGEAGTEGKVKRRSSGSPVSPSRASTAPSSTHSDSHRPFRSLSIARARGSSTSSPPACPKMARR